MGAFTIALVAKFDGKSARDSTSSTRVSSLMWYSTYVVLEYSVSSLLDEFLLYMLQCLECQLTCPL